MNVGQKKTPMVRGHGLDPGRMGCQEARRKGSGY